MKKAILCLFMFVIAVMQTKAQTFQKTFGTPGGDRPIDIIQTSDKGYAMLGVLNDQNVYILKTDSLGNKQWSKTYSLETVYSSELRTLVQTNDGGFIFSGAISYSSTSYAMVVKTDASGNITWSKMYVALSKVTGIRQTIEGDYIAVGAQYSGPGRSALIRFDTSGNIIWSRTLLVQSTAMDVIQLAGDSSFVTYFFPYNPSQKFTISRFSKNGSLGWSKTIPGFQLGVDYGHLRENGNEVQVALNGSNGGILSVNKNGSSARMFKMCCQLYNFTISDAFPMADKSSVFVSQYSGSHSIDIILGVMDSLGVMKWTNTIGGVGGDVPKSVKPTKDKGFIIAGMTNSFTSGGTDLYLIKTDSLGQSGCNTSGLTFTTTIGVMPLSNYTGTVDSLFNNFTSNQNVTISYPSELSYNACACYPPVADFIAGSSGEVLNRSFWAEKWYWTCTCAVGIDSTSGPYKSYYGSIPDGTYTVCLTVKNSCGVDSICKPFTYTYVPVSVEENMETVIGNIYPNPFHDQLLVTRNERSGNMDAIEIRVINSLGSLVYYGKIEESQKTVDLSTLASGLYFIQLTSNGKVVSRKLVKE